MSKEIKLTQGKVAIVDDEDYPALSQLNWHFSRGYAARSKVIDGKPRILLMHREMLGLSYNDILLGDHINCDPLDNRRANLRIATKGQNNQNSRMRKNNRSGLKGVHLDSRWNRWKAQIRVNGKTQYLGSFKDKMAAYAAYCAAVEKYHGEFGRLA